MLAILRWASETRRPEEKGWGIPNPVLQGAEAAVAVAEKNIMPPPALPTQLIAAAGDYASNVADIDPESCVGLAKKSDAAPGVVFALSAASKVQLAASVHPHAFEVADKAGWFGTSHKVVLRAVSADDANDWVVACTRHINDAVAAAKDQ
jgi:hypothetical protein